MFAATPGSLPLLPAVVVAAAGGCFRIPSGKVCRRDGEDVNHGMILAMPIRNNSENAALVSLCRL
ncbi:MAG TPA: hypothetical protein EYG03_26520 [Planctomycetes bacterium]|nr:hypothetical protein [Fuerstiella sp.]HIK95515.1 hypothetical protein [Planctomycetota bacterium]